MMQKRTLITGGAGFIGSHIIDRLLSQGHNILCIDNYSTGRQENLTQHSNLEVVEDTVYNARLMYSLITDFKPELIIHAAASYKNPKNWIEDSKTNATGAAILCQAAKEANVQRIIYFQTALCYGLNPQETPITLQHPLLPQDSSYAITKTTGEYFIRLSGIPFVSFRLANAYGPRNLSGPLPTFYHRLTNEQPCFVMDTRRDFIYIDDMIDCVMCAVNSNAQGIYHISSGTDFSVAELYKATTTALGINSEAELRSRHPDDAYSILLDPSRVINEFGWRPKISLTEGVRRTIEYYKEHLILETYSHL